MACRGISVTASSTVSPNAHLRLLNPHVASALHGMGSAEHRASVAVKLARSASISAVQRRFKIGYNRAARLVETMEGAGVVSTMGTNGSREVLDGWLPRRGLWHHWGDDRRVRGSARRRKP